MKLSHHLLYPLLSDYSLYQWWPTHISYLLSKLFAHILGNEYHLMMNNDRFRFWPNGAYASVGLVITVF